MQQTTTINGIEYISDCALTCGDYGGAGSVGVANIRALLAYADENDIDVPDYHIATWVRLSEGRHYEDDDLPESDMIHIHSGYRGEQIVVRADHEELKEMVDSLENYPLIDDEMHSLVEMEWEQEAWDSWLKDDLLRSLSDDTQEAAECISDSGLFELYRQAMEDCNEYSIPEYSGSHIAVDRISKRFGELVVERGQARAKIPANKTRQYLLPDTSN